MRKPDILEVRDIALFQPGQTIRFVDKHFFDTERVPVGQIGYALISGDRGFSFEQRALGFTIIENRLVIERAQTLLQHGLFSSEVVVRGVDAGSTVNVTMILPAQNMIFEVTERVNVDENELDPTERTTAMSMYWRMPNSSLEFRFFTPGDQNQLEQILAELRFSFKIQKPFLARPHTRRSLFNFRPET